MFDFFDVHEVFLIGRGTEDSGNRLIVEENMNSTSGVMKKSLHLLQAFFLKFFQNRLLAMVASFTPPMIKEAISSLTFCWSVFIPPTLRFVDFVPATVRPCSLTGLKIHCAIHQATYGLLNKIVIKNKWPCNEIFLSLDVTCY
jgi:hypothetical protein